MRRRATQSMVVTTKPLPCRRRDPHLRNDIQLPPSTEAIRRATSKA
jgi:hypothetical protein